MLKLYIVVVLLGLSQAGWKLASTCSKECLTDESICRWTLDETSKVVEACHCRNIVRVMYSSGVDDRFCGDPRAVVNVTEGEGGAILELLSCQGGETCPDQSTCTTDPESADVSYCCATPVTDESGSRKKRSARIIKRTKKQEKKNRRFLKARKKETTTIPAFTTSVDSTAAPTEKPEPTNCIREFVAYDVNKKYEKTVVSVELVQTLAIGYSNYRTCPKNSYSFKGTRFFVKGCQALFRICFEEVKETTVAPLTTESPDVCQKHISLQGLELDLDGIIVSVDFIPLPFQSFGYRNFAPGPGYGRNDDHCYRDVDYSFEGSRFKAAPACRGVFKICTRSKKTTQVPFTVTPAGPTCIKVTSSKDLKEEVNGEVISIELLRQIIPDFHYYAKICERGANYGFDGSKYYVKDCEGIFRVCFTDKPATEALTTTEQPFKCRRVVNTYGIKKTFDGTILSVTYIILKVRKDSKYPSCREGIDYNYDGQEFSASASCAGIFKICYRHVEPTPAFTVEPPKEMCKQVYSRRVLVEKFDGPIVSVTLVKQIVLGYSYGAEVCRQGKEYLISPEDTLRVKNCWALFLVCYQEPRPPTTEPAALTTSAPLQTTTAQVTCESVFNSYGLQLDFGKEIKSVVFIEVRSPEESGYRQAGFQNSRKRAQQGPNVGSFEYKFGGGFGGYRPQITCQVGKDYSYSGTELMASPNCQGFFQVCFEDKPEQLTTEAPTEPVCESLTVLYSRTKVYEGQRIVSVDLVRQFGLYGNGYCVQGKSYSFSGDTLKVRRCRGEFRVCVIPKPPTTPLPSTTIPAFSTTTSNICKRLYNNHGITHYFQGTIVSVIYLQVRQPKQPQGGYGYSLVEHADELCHNGIGYRYEGGFFEATSFCPGFFYVCYQSIDAAVVVPH